MFSFFSKYKTVNVGGNRIYLRKKSVDQEVYDYVFKDKYHHPYIELTSANPVILDLGANIGLTAVDYQLLYPGATIYSYEMDVDNYELARKNCTPYKSIHLFNKAVWYKEGVFTYNKSANADAYKLESLEGGSGTPCEVATTSIKSIIEENNIKWVDFVKLDIEGAELEVFQNDLSWLNKVSQTKIEVHYGEDVFAEIQRKLVEHGFETKKDTHHWSTIIAYRK
jgi:FkbM family methyltransferase